VLDDALLADWCLRYLGAPFERVLFRSGYLSDVVGVELSSGLRAVVKARPFQPRIAGCLQVQAALARVGFPMSGTTDRGDAGARYDSHGRDGNAWWQSSAHRSRSGPLRGPPRSPDRFGTRPSGGPRSG
jgi:hypothetical protein